MRQFTALLRNLIFRNLREDFETMSLFYAGTVHGAGLDCRTGDVHSFEGSTDGIWNKVGYVINFLLKTIPVFLGT